MIGVQDANLETGLQGAGKPCGRPFIAFVTLAKSQMQCADLEVGRQGAGSPYGWPHIYL